jgi:putative ABC transport system substrate-binding protein
MGHVRRRQFLAATGALLATSLARAQQSAKVKRIGLLGTTSDSPTVQRLWGAIREDMAALGWIEGKHYDRIDRWAQGDLTRLPALARELVALRPDAIFVGVTEAVPPAMGATRTIPIVAVAIADPVGAGFVKSLARPGVNLTGTTHAYPELNAKRMEFLKEALPTVSRVALLGLAEGVSHDKSIAHAESAAKVLGLALTTISIARPQDFESAFEAMRAFRADAVLIIPSAFMFVHRVALADFALRNRLPSIWNFASQAEAGGLIAYGPDLTAMWRRSAHYFDRIFRGARAENLPFERPSKFELAVNLRTARTLGLAIQKSVLLRADRVIE